VATAVYLLTFATERKLLAHGSFKKASKLLAPCMLIHEKPCSIVKVVTDAHCLQLFCLLFLQSLQIVIYTRSISIFLFSICAKHHSSPSFSISVLLLAATRRIQRAGDLVLLPSSSRSILSMYILDPFFSHLPTYKHLPR
jgi:hypothetical protein